MLFTELYHHSHKTNTPQEVRSTPKTAISAPPSVLRSLNSPESESNGSRHSHTANDTITGRTRSLSMNASDPEPDEPVLRRARLSLSDSLEDLSLHQNEPPIDTHSLPIHGPRYEEYLSEDQILPSNPSSSSHSLEIEGQHSGDESDQNRQQSLPNPASQSENEDGKQSQNASESEGMDLLELDQFSPPSSDSDMALEDGSVPN